MLGKSGTKLVKPTWLISPTSGRFAENFHGTEPPGAKLDLLSIDIHDNSSADTATEDISSVFNQVVERHHTGYRIQFVSG